MEALSAPVNVLKSVSSQAVQSKKMTTSPEKLEKTAKDFEAVFMAQMLKPMWEGVKTDGMFGGGAGEDAMRDLMLQEYGKSMVRNDKYGLSPAIMQAMIQMQEQANAQGVGG